ncbi:MAG: hypothetical protein AAF985_26415 [Bacteroidota bacterium]
MSNTCTECGRNFKGRSDAKTCSDLCRAKRSKRLKKEAILEDQVKAERAQSIQKIRTEIDRIEKENVSLSNQLEQLQKYKVNQQTNIRSIEQQIQEQYLRISKFSRQLKLKDHDFYNRYVSKDASFKLSEHISSRHYSIYMRNKSALKEAQQEKKKVQTNKDLLESKIPQQR